MRCDAMRCCPEHTLRTSFQLISALLNFPESCQTRGRNVERNGREGKEAGECGLSKSSFNCCQEVYEQTMESILNGTYSRCMKRQRGRGNSGTEVDSKIKTKMKTEGERLRLSCCGLLCLPLWGLQCSLAPCVCLCMCVAVCLSCGALIHHSLKWVLPVKCVYHVLLRLFYELPFSAPYLPWFLQSPSSPKYPPPRLSPYPPLATCIAHSCVALFKLHTLRLHLVFKVNNFWLFP